MATITVLPSTGQDTLNTLVSDNITLFADGHYNIDGEIGNEGIYIPPSNTLTSKNIENATIYSGAENDVSIFGSGTLQGSNNTIIGGTIGANSTIGGTLQGATLYGGSDATVNSNNYTILGGNASMGLDTLFGDSIDGVFENSTIIGGSVTGSIFDSSISGGTLIGGTVTSGEVYPADTLISGDNTITSSNEPVSIQSSNDNVRNTIDLSLQRSGNGSAISALKRMEIIYGDISIKFAINPSDYTQKEPNRATLTQTKGGAWIDAWGAGIAEFNIKGITGVQGYRKLGANEGTGVDVGYTRWIQLRDLFRSVFSAVQDGEPVTELVKFYNYTDNEFWYCYPTQQGIELYRSKSKPHIYQYTISLWGIRRIGEPESTTGKIGNPYKEEEFDTIDTTTEEETESTTTESDTNTASTISPENPTEVEEGDNIEPDIPNETTIEGGAVTTTIEIEESRSGGMTYTSGSLSLDSESDVSIRVYTRNKSTNSLRQDSETYMTAIQTLIGGTDDGKIVPSTGYHVTEELQITQQGSILNITPLTAQNLNKLQPLISDFDVHRLLKEVKFTNTVSTNTYNMYTQIKEFDPTILSPEYVLPIGSTPKERVQQAINNNKVYGSTIYRLMSSYRAKYYLSKVDTKYIKAALLESMYVYRELYKIVNSSGKIITTLSVSNMKILIKNLDAIILYLETNTLEDHMFYIRNLMWELRQLEYYMIQILADIVVYV